jgi:double-stranded uracil-DNA glycosylase
MPPPRTDEQSAPNWAAEPGGDVPDLVAPGLRVLFCGINPGTVSGRLAQHFARPGNRFWKALHGSGFTDRLLAPAEQWALLQYGIGITNLVDRTSRAAADVAPAELRAGAGQLAEKADRWKPDWVAVLGVQAFRTAFRRPQAAIGRQPERVADSGLWLLPNPSGLQARYQLPEMISLFSELRAAAFSPARRSSSTRPLPK